MIYLAIKAAATVRIFEFRRSANTVSRFPITPTTMITNVKTPAAVIIVLEYLEEQNQLNSRAKGKKLIKYL